MNAPERIRLTEFSHGGGCGCKIAPAVLSEILASTPIRGLPKDLLVGTETADDAAVYRLNDSQALVATTDFFTPIVDDPFDFGRIAATNAISDVYAMGAQPDHRARDRRHAAREAAGVGDPEDPRRRRVGLRGRRHSDRGRAFDRYPRADLRPRRPRAWFIPTRSSETAPAAPAMC